jgi:hypothetical protein
VQITFGKENQLLDIDAKPNVSTTYFLQTALINYVSQPKDLDLFEGIYHNRSNKW